MFPRDRRGGRERWITSLASRCAARGNAAPISGRRLQDTGKCIGLHRDRAVAVVFPWRGSTGNRGGKRTAATIFNVCRRGSRERAIVTKTCTRGMVILEIGLLRFIPRLERKRIATRDRGL